MAPLVRRSWAPRGDTPILRQRTRSHQKVSVIAAPCVAPDRAVVRRYFRLHPNANINARRIVAFLSQWERQLAAPFVVVWDRLSAHRSVAVRQHLATRPQARSVCLPPYAPELNPVEYLWGYLKRNPLANLAIPEVQELADTARSCTRSIQRRSDLLKSFVQHSPLPLQLK